MSNKKSFGYISHNKMPWDRKLHIIDYLVDAYHQYIMVGVMGWEP